MGHPLLWIANLDLDFMQAKQRLRKYQTQVNLKTNKHEKVKSPSWLFELKS